MRTLLLVFVLVACLALAFDEYEENKKDKACGPGDDPQGMCRPCKSCGKQNKNWNLCKKKKYKKECRKAKGDGFCCCYNSDDTLPAACKKRRKEREERCFLISFKKKLPFD